MFISSTLSNVISNGCSKSSPTKDVPSGGSQEIPLAPLDSDLYLYSPISITRSEYSSILKSNIGEKKTVSGCFKNFIASAFFILWCPLTSLSASSTSGYIR